MSPEIKNGKKKQEKKTIVRGCGNVDNPKPPPEPPPSNDRSTVPSSTEDYRFSFDPQTYRLADGSPLSLQTQRSFAKYEGEDYEKLIRSIRYYEEQIAKGAQPKTTHERMLQGIIKNDYGKQEGVAMRNKLYAGYIIEDQKIRGVTFLKSVVRIQIGRDTESISLSLPEEQFTRLFDHLISKIRDGNQ